MLESYLPTEKQDLARVTRGWLCNMIFTLVGDKFSDFVDETVAKRNEKVSQKQNLMLELDPDIAQVFKQSNQISSKYLGSH